MKKEDKEKKIYSKDDVSIRVDSRQYILKTNGHLSYYPNLEGALRELLSVMIKKKITGPEINDVKKTYRAILEAEVFVKEVASAIPFRELPEAPDVHVDAKTYFEDIYTENDVNKG